MKIKYSPDARDRLKQIKNDAGTKVVGTITNGINNLKNTPKRCPSIENMLGIPSPYYFLHIEHNYVFYTVTKDKVVIVDIYNEKEDFMWKLFGVQTRLQDTDDYWNE